MAAEAESEVGSVQPLLMSPHVGLVAQRLWRARVLQMSFLVMKKV